MKNFFEYWKGRVRSQLEHSAIWDGKNILSRASANEQSDLELYTRRED